jgi:hypothetical protein
MMRFVFLSHAEEDSNFADRVFGILEKMGISCFIYERFPEYGNYIPEIIKRNINGCRTFVVLLTQNGVQSQVVNQEIGMAFALNKGIIPIVERGVETKGFVELRQHINYAGNKQEGAISDLLYRLRVLYPNHNKLKLYCMNKECENKLRPFRVVLPTQQEISDAITRNLQFRYECPSCGHMNYISPETLEQNELHAK